MYDGCLDKWHFEEDYNTYDFTVFSSSGFKNKEPNFTHVSSQNLKNQTVEYLYSVQFVRRSSVARVYLVNRFYSKCTKAITTSQSVGPEVDWNNSGIAYHRCHYNLPVILFYV